METKTVIVTGASGGLGAAIARELGKLGASVTLTARRPEQLAITAAEVQQGGGKTLVVPGDLTEASTVQRVVDETLQNFGAIDAIVHNAGTIDPIQLTQDADLDAWRYAFEVNLFAPLALTRAALPSLRERRGRVLGISTGAAVHPYATLGAYSASKASLNNFLHALSAEEPDVITLSLRPGAVDTSMQTKVLQEGKGLMPEGTYNHFYARYENNELLDPAEPAHTAAILALHTPLDWSGRFMDWTHEHIRRLVERVATGSSRGEL